MRTKDKKAKDFDTVKAFREIKEKISSDIQGMSFEELKAYLADKSPKIQAWSLNYLPRAGCYEGDFRAWPRFCRCDVQPRIAELLREG